MEQLGNYLARNANTFAERGCRRRRPSPPNDPMTPAFPETERFSKKPGRELSTIGQSPRGIRGLHTYVPQQIAAPDYESGGREFESLRARQKPNLFRKNEAGHARTPRVSVSLRTSNSTKNSRFRRKESGSIWISISIANMMLAIGNGVRISRSHPGSIRLLTCGMGRCGFRMRQSTVARQSQAILCGSISFVAKDRPPVGTTLPGEHRCATVSTRRSDLAFWSS